MLGLLKSGEFAIEQILYALGRELTGGKQLPDFHQKFESNLKISIPDIVREEHDLIGDCYQYLSSKYERLKKGSFYTTEKIIESIVKDLKIDEKTSIFDPACGSGNLILNSKVKNPLQVHGLDNDPLAVMCCQFNYYLKFGNDAPSPDIKCGCFQDFLKAHDKSLKFDVIICNPPYGADMIFTEVGEVKSIDCLDFFVEHASELTATSIFILPETVINVKKHESLRSWILQKKKLTEIKNFGATIAGTKHVTEIVTGDDENFLLDKPTAISEPVITGKHIEPYKITGEKYINYEESREQLAIAVKDSYFRTSEKLIYHTVSRYLEFAIDSKQRLTTCTANFFIVKDIVISTKCIMAIFNSKIYNRLNKLLFGDKVNRGCNIKKLPIPILDDALQKEMEKYVDEEKYEKIEEMLSEIFKMDNP